MEDFYLAESRSYKKICFNRPPSVKMAFSTVGPRVGHVNKRRYVFTGNRETANLQTSDAGVIASSVPFSRPIRLATYNMIGNKSHLRFTPRTGALPFVRGIEGDINKGPPPREGYPRPSNSKPDNGEADSQPIEPENPENPEDNGGEMVERPILDENTTGIVTEPPDEMILHPSRYRPRQQDINSERWSLIEESTANVGNRVSQGREIGSTVGGILGGVGGTLATLVTGNPSFIGQGIAAGQGIGSATGALVGTGVGAFEGIRDRIAFENEAKERLSLPEPPLPSPYTDKPLLKIDKPIEVHLPSEFSDRHGTTGVVSNAKRIGSSVANLTDAILNVKGAVSEGYNATSGRRKTSQSGSSRKTPSSGGLEMAEFGKLTEIQPDQITATPQSQNDISSKKTPLAIDYFDSNNNHIRGGTRPSTVSQSVTNTSGKDLTNTIKSILPDTSSGSQNVGGSQVNIQPSESEVPPTPETSIVNRTLEKGKKPDLNMGATPESTQPSRIPKQKGSTVKPPSGNSIPINKTTGSIVKKPKKSNKATRKRPITENMDIDEYDLDSQTPYDIVKATETSNAPTISDTTMTDVIHKAKTPKKPKTPKAVVRSASDITPLEDKRKTKQVSIKETPNVETTDAIVRNASEITPLEDKRKTKQVNIKETPQEMRSRANSGESVKSEESEKSNKSNTSIGIGEILNEIDSPQLVIQRTTKPRSMSGSSFSSSSVSSDGSPTPKGSSQKKKMLTPYVPDSPKGTRTKRAPYVKKQQKQQQSTSSNLDKSKSDRFKASLSSVQNSSGYSKDQIQEVINESGKSLNELWDSGTSHLATQKQKHVTNQLKKLISQHARANGLSDPYEKKSNLIQPTGNTPSVRARTKTKKYGFEDDD
jgi:hypothetical protein